MSLSFTLPKRLQQRLAKLAELRAEKKRLEKKEAELEAELYAFGQEQLLGHAGTLGKLPDGPYQFSGEISATYVLHDSSTPAVSAELAEQIEELGLSVDNVCADRRCAQLATEAALRPEAFAAAIAAAREGIQRQSRTLGEHFTRQDLDGLVEITEAKILRPRRIQESLSQFLGWAQKGKLEAVGRGLKALRATQYLKIAG